MFLWRLSGRVIAWCLAVFIFSPWVVAQTVTESTPLVESYLISGDLSFLILAKGKN